jgi:hypothetical protein
MRFLGPLAGAVAIAGVMIALVAPHHGSTVLDPVAKAADTTAAAGTAEFGMAGSMQIAGQSIPMNGSGTLDMRSQHMRMSMSFPIPGLGQTDMEEIFDGNAFYMRFPAALTQRLPGGKPWMKIDLDTLGKASGVDLKQVMQANQSNPADMLQSLKAVGSSHVVGREDIGGAPTTHYQATVDLSKAAQRIPDKKTAAAVKQLFAATGTESIPVDVWIDRAGRVRRQRVRMTTSAVSMDLTIEFTRFGVAVDTTPPPADQVMDAGALLNAGANGSVSG